MGRRGVVVACSAGPSGDLPFCAAEVEVELVPVIARICAGTEEMGLVGICCGGVSTFMLMSLFGLEVTLDGPAVELAPVCALGTDPFSWNSGLRWSSLLSNLG